jgi:hypothetical protein
LSLIPKRHFYHNRPNQLRKHLNSILSFSLREREREIYIYLIGFHPLLPGILELLLPGNRGLLPTLTLNY